MNDTIKIELLDGYNKTTEYVILQFTIHRRAEHV
jgi:hypothetical protein